MCRWLATQLGPARHRPGILCWTIITCYVISVVNHYIRTATNDNNNNSIITVMLGCHVMPSRGQAMLQHRIMSRGVVLCGNANVVFCVLCCYLCCYGALCMLVWCC